MPPGDFFGIQILQNSISAGAAQDPTEGAYDAPPDPLVGWEGGYPSLLPTPLNAFDVSISSRPSMSSLCAIGTECDWTTHFSNASATYYDIILKET